MSKFSAPSNHEGIIAIPLGGCGQIGKNMMLYCYRGTWIMLDCGASFGDERIVPGADIIIPDIKFIRDNKIKISAIILTHVHEDHVGAVSHYIKDLNCPIYATKFAIEFTKLRLKDRGVKEDGLKFIDISTLPEQFKIGHFTIEPVFITHSIPEMHGMLIRGGKVSIFHTGDWKFDDVPVVGQRTDYNKIKQMGADGLTALVCDSTNVLSEGRSASEGDLEHNLYNIISQKKGMVIITTFASNVARIQTICNVAKKVGRTVALAGLSLNKIVSIAQKSGYLQGESFIDAKDAMAMERRDVLLICTGCQGEPLASIAKISNHSHPIVKVHSHDTVIFSSKIIPGNEKKIISTLNRFADKNIEVITERDAMVHVSGHPKKEELREMYSMLKPKFSIPVHGDSVNLRHHCEFAAREKLASKAIFIQDGDAIMIEPDNISKIGKVYADYLCIDGTQMVAPSSKTMQERRKIKDSGAITFGIIYEMEKNKVVDIRICNLGAIEENRAGEKLIEDILGRLHKILTPEIKAMLSKTKKLSEKDFNSIEQNLNKFIKSAISKIIEKSIQKTPVISSFLHIVK